MGESDPGPLTKAQRDIMEVVWAAGEVTVTEVRDALAKKRELARNTVQTMMVRLDERGWLQHRERGRTFIYSAARPKIVSLGAKVSQMVDPVPLQGDAFDQRGLHLVGHKHALDEIFSGDTCLLRHGQQGHDAVSGMARVQRKKAVVEIQLAHRRCIRVGSPGAIHSDI